MSGIYPLDREKNLILYPSQNTLYLRTTQGENFTRPVILCTDYEKNLSDTVHNGTIYYTYQNTTGDIVVRSITDLQELYHIHSAKSPDCQNPLLVSFDETLILFYAVKNPIGDNYYIKALFPFHPEKHLSTTERSFAACPVLSTLSVSGGLVFCAETENRTCLFFMDSSFACHEMDVTGEDNGKIDKAQADAEKNILLENAAHLQQEIHMRDTMLESAKRQYAELMETASKYKAEAAKWHELAHKKDARPIPGERLVSDDW